MTTSNRKHTIILSILILLAFLISGIIFPSARWMLSISFLVLSIVVMCTAIVRRNWGPYLQGKITRNVFLRNTILELFGILLAMTLAGLLGRYLAQIATVQIDHDFMRLITGISIGILVGVFVGLFVNRTWGRWIKP